MGRRSKKAGRPTKMTTATLGKLREAFLWGASDAEACLVAQIHPDTLYAYQKEHPEFTEEKEVCKLNPVLKARKTVYDNLDKVGTARWYLEKRLRKEFGDELGSVARHHAENHLPRREKFLSFLGRHALAIRRENRTEQ